MFVNISLKLDFQDVNHQITMYDVPASKSVPYQSGEWIGSTKKGGSCNFNTVSITPHCNGTHTECIGHIVNDAIFLPDILLSPFFPSLLITIPFHIYETANIHETYLPKLEIGDKILLKKDLETALNPYLNLIQNNPIEGLIIRTKPNEITKKNRDYNKIVAPFFTHEAITFITNLNFKHLLVDIPSLDKAYDEGLLSNHHTFWNQSLKNYELEPSAFKNKTITELIYIPDDILDGVYDTFIGFPNWKEDAVPSSVWIQKM